MPFENRSRSAFPDPTVSDLDESYGNLSEMVQSVRTWPSVVRWLSPTWVVARVEREATGPHGEAFSWTWINATEIRDGQFVSACLFDLDDEDAAFAYADERMKAGDHRLAVTNAASRRLNALMRAGQMRNVDAMVDCYVEGFVYDDRRRLSGNPIRDLRATAERILAQYSEFEARILAVRGERLQLGWCRWSNESGFETTHLTVNETGENGRFIYEARFDEDDFEGAYRELARRHYEGEGAEIAETGPLADELTAAMDRGEYDRILTELTVPDFRLENRSRSIFPDRSAAEMVAGFEEMSEMVTSTRTWNSALSWLSPSVLIGRNEREATGADGERYAWAGINVAVLRAGKFASICLFEVEDEAAAFAYAEEQVRQEEQR
jgi:hypothetical protein